MDNYIIPEVPLSQKFYDLVAQHLTPLSEKEEEFKEMLEEQESWINRVERDRQVYFDSWKPGIASDLVERYVESIKDLLHSLEEVIDPTQRDEIIKGGEEALFAIKSLEVHNAYLKKDKNRMHEKLGKLGKRLEDEVADHLKKVIADLFHWRMF